MTAPSSPVFVAPSTPGQMTNKHGTNSTTDAIGIGVKYSNLLSGNDPAGTLRITANKSIAGIPTVILDTWWMGAGTALTIPDSMDVGPNAAFTYDPGTGPRVYIAHNNVNFVKTNKRIYSAPLNGPSVGRWREEQFPATAIASGIHSLIEAKGYAYASSNLDPRLWFAKINGDGTFGTWSLLTIFGWNVGEMISFSDATGSYIYGFCPSGTTNTWAATVRDDGRVTTVPGPALPANRSFCGAYVKPSGNGDGAATLYLIGGGNLASIVRSLITGGSTMGTWAALGTGLPAARTNMAFAVVTNPTDTLYVIGGTSDGTLHTTPTTTIYHIPASSLGSAWTTDATTLSIAAAGGGGVTSQIPGGTANVVLSQIWLFGAAPAATIGGNFTCVQINIADNTQAVSSILGTVGVGGNKGVGAALAASDLGTNGTLVSNPDGSQIATHFYGIINASPNIPTLVDGDVVTISAQWTDNQTGDLSQVALTSFKVGQPPTITSIVPTGAITNRQPPVSFVYNAGSGGAAEYKYQIQIKDNGGNIVADTGLIAGNANAYSPKLYPMLASGVAASTVITVYSADNPMPGSTNSVSVTTAFTPTQAAPTVPTSGGVAVDNVGGAVIPSWTNPVGGVTPTFNRLWWALAASSVWLPAKDLIVPNAQGTANSFTLMDTIPLGTSIKVGVSSLVGASPGTGESAVTFLGTVTINPDYHQDLGGYTAMIHVVGNGPNQRVPLPNIPPISFDTSIDSSSTMMFGNAAPSMRYGPYSYRTITIPVIPLDAQIPTLDSILAAVQSGAILCYRDTVGNVIYCGLPDKRSRKKDLYYADTLTLVETQFKFAP